MRTLIAIPVFNEAKYLVGVLTRVCAKAQELGADVLVIDDGSTDGTRELLRGFDVRVIQHEANAGYGRSMRDAFDLAIREYDWVVTMDCDEQHEPEALPRFFEAARDGTHDVISGSRYLDGSCDAIGSPPADRRSINTELTAEINERLGSVFEEAGGGEITDAFCGFKAYRSAALAKLELSEDGYAFPMQFWVQAAAARLAIREIPVRLIYNDPNRSFGGPLDDACVRRGHYRRVLHCELERCADRLPAPALEDTCCGCP